MSILLKSFVCMPYKHEILAVVHLVSSLWPNKQHQTSMLEITGRLETNATCSNIPQDLSWGECSSWLLLIPFWLGANYIFLRTFCFLSLLSSTHFPLQEIIFPGTPHWGGSISESSQITGVSPNQPPYKTQQNHRDQSIHREAANTAMLTKGFSPQAIGTKMCTRLSGLGTEAISLPASGLVWWQIPRQPRPWYGDYIPAILRIHVKAISPQVSGLISTST